MLFIFQIINYYFSKKFSDLPKRKQKYIKFSIKKKNLIKIEISPKKEREREIDV